MNKHDADLRKLSMDWVDAFTWLCEADELAEREAARRVMDDLRAQMEALEAEQEAQNEGE